MQTCDEFSLLGPTPMPFLADTPIKEFELVPHTNLNGPFTLTRALIGQLLGRLGRFKSGPGPSDPHLGGGIRWHGCSHQQRGPR